MVALTISPVSIAADVSKLVYSASFQPAITVSCWAHYSNCSNRLLLHEQIPSNVVSGIAMPALMGLCCMARLVSGNH